MCKNSYRSQHFFNVPQTLEGKKTIFLAIKLRWSLSGTQVELLKFYKLILFCLSKSKKYQNELKHQQLNINFD